ncbi:hypothetical protein FOPE_03515 [Fonsecaea pedrosoi]|nr:hypothetical protein FOPE_03515 [Fonsecaea pedrosoi]
MPIIAFSSVVRLMNAYSGLFKRAIFVSQSVSQSRAAMERSSWPDLAWPSIVYRQSRGQSVSKAGKTFFNLLEEDPVESTDGYTVLC